MAKQLVKAERGCVYEFFEKDGTSRNLCVVISNNKRASDKIINILMLKDDLPCEDTIDVEVNHQRYVVHCGCVTYTYRNQLGRKICKLSENKLSAISDSVMAQLGINIPDMGYKQLYELLLDKVLNKTS